MGIQWVEVGTGSGYLRPEGSVLLPTSQPWGAVDQETWSQNLKS